MTRAQKKGRRMAALERRIKKFFIGGVIAATVIFAPGFYDGQGVLVETTYKVRRGDVLRDISETYLEKNTYGRRYILEFEEGIHELNPWIREQNGVIYPGQIIRINYWVNAGEKP